MQDFYFMIFICVILPFGISFQIWNIWTEDLRLSIELQKDTIEMMKRWLSEEKSQINQEDISKEINREQYKIDELNKELKKKSVLISFFALLFCILVFNIIGYLS